MVRFDVLDWLLCVKQMITFSFEFGFVGQTGFFCFGVFGGIFFEKFEEDIG
jgi:hypothetical protein